MAGGVEVARAYVTIIPKTDGTSDEVISSITNPLEKKVGAAGEKAGGSFNAGLGSILSKFAAPTAIIGTLVGIGKAGLDIYEEVQGGMNEIIKATGASGETAEELKTVYKNVSKSVVGSFEDIGAAIGDLNTRLNLNGEELEYASEQAMKYAKINDTDVTSSIDAVTRMMNNAGIPADQFDEYLDKLTVAAQMSGINVDQLSQLVNDNAVSFQELGFTTDEAIAMLAQFEKSGANTSAILAGMKKGVQNWTKEGKSAKEGFADFVKGVQNGTVTAQDAMDLFGAKAGQTMFDAASKGQLSFEEMFAAIEDSAGAVDQVYEDTLTGTERMGQAWQGIKVALADVFAPLAEGLAWVLDQAATGISWLVDNVGEGVALITDFFSNFDENVTEIWNGIKSTAETVWNGVKTAIMTPITTVKTWLATQWERIKQTASTVWEGIKTAITTPIETAKEFISGIIEKIKGFFNFEISWPHIPMPHFSIQPEGWQIGDLLKGSIPHLGIDWYAKGGIFTNASVIGVGEAGNEAVIPLQGKYMKPFAEAIADEIGDDRTVIFNFTAYGTENPEEFMARALRQAKLEMRMA